jgi:lysophospholipase L1-like esterase
MKVIFAGMKFQVDINIPPLPQPLRYTDKILLTGSCFTEHIAERLEQHHFRLLSNPNGILFNPVSVADSLTGYLQGKRYAKEDLFYLNELWNSWDHHTRFSDIDRETALAGINQSQSEATKMICGADWLIITLGSAFQYYLKEGDQPVANNHRAPGQWFEKKLLTVEQITTALSNMLGLLHLKNPGAKVLLTISPVRHIRDGVVDNNRSKARLIEAVHELCGNVGFVHYFPSYELLIDVLRDYRYYDTDLVHPNYAATSYVWETFVTTCIEEETKRQMAVVMELSIARKHRPRFVQTQAHRDFCAKYAAKANELQLLHPYLDLSDTVTYFSKILKE